MNDSTSSDTWYGFRGKCEDNADRKAHVPYRVREPIKSLEYMKEHSTHELIGRSPLSSHVLLVLA